MCVLVMLWRLYARDRVQKIELDDPLYRVRSSSIEFNRVQFSELDEFDPGPRPGPQDRVHRVQSSSIESNFLNTSCSKLAVFQNVGNHV